MEIGGRNWGNARKRCGCVKLWEGLLTEEKEIKIFVKVKCATYVINGRFERNARKSWSLMLRNITSKLKWKIDKPSFVFVKKITRKHIANRKFPTKDWVFYNIVSREICTIKKITEEDLVSSSSPSPVCMLRSLLPDISHVFTLSRYLAVTPRLCVIERGHQCFVMRRRLNIAGPSSSSSIKYVRDVLSFIQSSTLSSPSLFAFYHGSLYLPHC